MANHRWGMACESAYRAAWVAALLAITGCSSSSGEAKNCGTVSAPLVFTLKNISPAVGASLPNSAIVQTFTIVGLHISLAPTFSLPTTHTAGQPSPSPVPWTPQISGADTLYTSMPLTWAMAGHVEEDPVPGEVEEDTTAGCIYKFPPQIFSYDVTAP